MKLSDSIISAYNASRTGTDRSLVCHAPYVNLNFEQNGNVRACCYNTKHSLGIWPQQTLQDMWQGAAAQELRDYIAHHDLGGGCAECGHMITSGNYQGVRAHYYDEYAPGGPMATVQRWYRKMRGRQPYPRVMEFELSNECNLECVMCNGYFSSSIRKNREKLPPVPMVYDDRFVDELEEFIPHLTDAKFLGGEPFMIDIYLRIWERIRQINPGIRIHITTNATFLNRRIKDLLDGLNAGIILSIDSVNPDTYRKIRVNGNYQKVMENLEYFRDYTRRKKTFLSLAACPITYNWQELPEMLRFCLDRDIALYFNAVFSPSEYSLRDQSQAYLQHVISTLEAYPLPAVSGGATSPARLSVRAYADFILMLKGWLAEKKETLQATDAPVYTAMEVPLIREQVGTWSLQEIKDKLRALAEVSGTAYVDKEVALLNRLANLFVATPPGSLQDVILCYFDFCPEADPGSYSARAAEIAAMIEAHPRRDQVLVMMSRATPSDLAHSFYQADTESLRSQLAAAFG
ncbi:MAG: radical SAM protein [Bacteroidetes bacterium]|nr:radical SAM protein [Bacteroidota bacterium]